VTDTPADDVPSGHVRGEEQPSSGIEGQHGSATGESSPSEGTERPLPDGPLPTTGNPALDRILASVVDGADGDDDNEYTQLAAAHEQITQVLQAGPAVNPVPEGLRPSHD
jgi:hypothetical protein